MIHHGWVGFSFYCLKIILTNELVKIIVGDGLYVQNLLVTFYSHFFTNILYKNISVKHSIFNILDEIKFETNYY